MAKYAKNSRSPTQNIVSKKQLIFKEAVITKKILMSLMLLSFIFTGCSTMKNSIVTGLSAGAITGGTTGVIAGKKKKDALTGMLIGGLVGGVASYFIHNGLEKRDKIVRKDTLLNLEKFDIQAPYSFNGETEHGLSMPTVDSQWIETQVKGKKLIEGHRMWIISEDPKWIPNVKRDKNKK